MHTILSLLLSAVLPSLRGGASLQFELIALRHQLLVLERKRTTQSRLTRIDRFLWVWLYRLWPGCLDVGSGNNLPETGHSRPRIAQLHRGNRQKQIYWMYSCQRFSSITRDKIALGEIDEPDLSMRLNILYAPFIGNQEANLE